MAHITQMPTFRGTATESWTAYAERVDYFFVGNGITDDKKKHALLLSSLDPATFQLLKGMVHPEALTAKTYKEVVELLKKHFNPKPSVIVSRYRFNSRERRQSETVSQYIAELRSLAEHCAFDDKLEDMLRDRLVCGINEERIQRRLLQETDLKFDKALQLATAMETASQGIRDLQSSPSGISTKTESVHKVHQKQQHQNRTVTCHRCLGNHLATNCRFQEAVCHSCRKKGHLAKACRSKPVNKPSQTGQSQRSFKSKGTHQVRMSEGEKTPEANKPLTVGVSKEDAYTLFSVKGKTSPLVVSIVVDKQPLLMEVDTGAALSIISQTTFHKQFPNHELEPTGTPALCTYTGEVLNVMGTFQVEVEYNTQTATLPLTVIAGDGPSLLGRNWLKDIRLDWPRLLCIPNATNSLESVLEEHSELFRDKLGCIRDTKARIFVNEHATPKFFKPRPVPYHLKQKVELELERLQKEHIISPLTTTEWATPVVPVPKDNGTVRLCGDYKVTINKCIEKEVYPLPRIEDLFAALGGGTVFSKIDLTRAYQQLPLEEGSKKFTVINTHKGLFRYERLPFGISTAPAIFQRQMECMLSGLPGVCTYLDDILVMGKDESDHLRNLREVLHRLKEAGLTVQKSKCVFATPSIEYLGHIIDSTGLHPSPTKVEAINRAPEPHNITELKSFLGLINYYCKFLPDLSTVLSPLYRLLQQTVQWTWSEKEQEAFVTAKQMLTSSAVLVHYDPNKDLVLMCDASPYGVGAVLSHRLEDGSDRPIAFASRTLSQTEKKYCQLEKEGLAIVFGVKRFHQFLFGRKFTILSDHQPLKFIFSESRQIPLMSSARVQRWAMTLSAYDYSIEYRAGKRMGNADALSRVPLPETLPSVPEPEEIIHLIDQLQRVIVTADHIKKWTEADPLSAKVYRYVQQGWTDEGDPGLQPYANRQNELSTQGGCILWGNRVIVPPAGRRLVLEQLHETHPGVTRMKRLARSYVWWPGLDREIEEYVRHCTWCDENKTATAAKTPIHPWEWPSRPWARVHMDHAGPVKGKLILILIDAHSKWVEAHVVKSTSAEATIAVLRSVFSVHGVPEQLVSDNGSGFASVEFNQFTTSLGIHHTFSAPYHPATNGLAERAVQLVKKALDSYTEGEDMDAHLNTFLMRYRITPHSTTGYSPSELLMGRRIRTVLDQVFPNLATKVQKKQEQQVASHSPKRPCPQIVLGEKVYAQNYGRGAKWTPATVIKITGPLSFIVKTRNNLHLRRHRSQLKKRTTDGSSSGRRTTYDDFDDFPSPMEPTTGPASPNIGPPPGGGTTVIPRRSNRTRRPPDRLVPHSS